MTTELLAHLRLFGRHRRTVRVGGTYWSYCNHRSHRRRLRCWRWFRWQGCCTKHNRSCFSGCPIDDKEGTTHDR